jgi:hypothetical protein
VLRGKRREETDRFIALRSYYLFDSAFTRRLQRQVVCTREAADGVLNRARHPRLDVEHRSGFRKPIGRTAVAKRARSGRRRSPRARSSCKALRTTSMSCLSCQGRKSPPRPE